MSEICQSFKPHRSKSKNEVKMKRPQTSFFSQMFLNSYFLSVRQESCQKSRALWEGMSWSTSLGLQHEGDQLSLSSPCTPHLLLDAGCLLLWVKICDPAKFHLTKSCQLWSCIIVWGILSLNPDDESCKHRTSEPFLVLLEAIKPDIVQYVYPGNRQRRFILIKHRAREFDININENR